MEQERSGGCLLDVFMAFIFAFVGAFTGFSVSMPPPADNFTEIYTLRADASIEELATAQEVLVLRLETLLNKGQIAGYEMLGMTTDGEIPVSITGAVLDQAAMIDALTRIGRLELVDLSALPADVQAEGQTISTLLDSEAQVILTNRGVAMATLIDDLMGGFAVQIDFTPEAAEIMGTFTESHIGTRLAIVVDGVVLSAPTIQARVDTTAVISGNFTEAEAQALAAQISTPPLPVQLELVGVG